MPKFYRQNKKRIDPRYFLNETANRDEDINEIEMSNQDDQTFQYNQAMAYKKKTEQGYTDEQKDEMESSLDSIAQSPDADNGNPLPQDDQIKFVDVMNASLNGDLSSEQIKSLIAATEAGELDTLKDVVSRIAGSEQGAGSVDTDLSKIDRDGDGKISADQLANIANAIKKNQA